MVSTKEAPPANSAWVAQISDSWRHGLGDLDGATYVTLTGAANKSPLLLPLMHHLGGNGSHLHIHTRDVCIIVTPRKERGGGALCIRVCICMYVCAYVCTDRCRSKPCASSREIEDPRVTFDGGKSDG